MARDRRFDFRVVVGMRQEELGLTGTLIGASCGISQTRCSNWVTGKELPADGDQVRALANVLKLDADYLIGVWQKTSEAIRQKGDPILTRTYKVRKKPTASTRDRYKRT